MPRRAAADLSIVRLPGRDRAAPPADLSEPQRQAWRAIVDSAPGGFLDGAAQLVLRRILAQIALVERHEERLERIAEAGGDFESEREIGREHREVSKSIVALMTALRVTPRSRMAARNARDRYARSPSGRRPWDIEARTAEAGKTTEGGGADEADHGEAPA
jgi:hypothetical protein